MLFSKILCFVIIDDLQCFHQNHRNFFIESSTNHQRNINASVITTVKTLIITSPLETPEKIQVMTPCAENQAQTGENASGSKVVLHELMRETPYRKREEGARLFKSLFFLLDRTQQIYGKRKISKKFGRGTENFPAIVADTFGCLF